MKGNSEKEAAIINTNRRKFLKISLLAAVAAFIPDYVQASFSQLMADERALSIVNLNTKEYVETVYWSNGHYNTEALDEINYIFRDSRSGAVKPIDRKLLDLLHLMRLKLKNKEPFHLISGYRSPASNELLRRQNRGAAKNSLHLYGQAADIRLPGCSLKKLRHSAYKLKLGGVGYYTRSNFVHIDVGKVRYWNDL